MLAIFLGALNQAVSTLQCGLILILNATGVSGAALWSIGSVLSAFFNVFNLFSFYTNMKDAVKNARLLTIMWAMQWFSVGVIVVNILSAADIVFHRGPGSFLVGLMWGLGLTAGCLRVCCYCQPGALFTTKRRLNKQRQKPPNLKQRKQCQSTAKG